MLEKSKKDGKIQQIGRIIQMSYLGSKMVRSAQLGQILIWDFEDHFSVHFTPQSRYEGPLKK